MTMTNEDETRWERITRFLRGTRYDLGRVWEALIDFDLAGAWHALWGWEPLYWLRCHLWTKYHIVDTRNEWYRWGWRDVDGLLLYANFELLRRFVEDEKGLDHLSYQGEWKREAAENEEDPVLREKFLEAAKESDRVYLEASSLYYWWTVIRALEQKALDDCLTDRSRSHTDYSVMEQERYEKDTENICRLARIRQHLWT